MKRVIKLLDHPKAIIFTSWLFLSFMWIIYAFVTLRSADEGVELANIDRQIMEYRVNNMALQDEIANHNSFNYIYPLAISLGFQDNKRVEYLK